MAQDNFTAYYKKIMERAHEIFKRLNIVHDHCKNKGNFIDIGKYRGDVIRFGIDKLYGIIAKCKMTFTEFFFAIDYPDDDFKAMGTKGYIGTGNVQSGQLRDFWEWDQTTNIWTQKTDFGGVSRLGAVGFSIGNKGYIGTGRDSTCTNLNDFWEYSTHETGVNEIKNQISISIFPNPFSFQTVLQTANSFRNATLTVDNCLGQTVKQIDNLSGQTVVLSRDNLASGLYFVRLTTARAGTDGEENKTIAVGKLIVTD